MSKLKVKAIGVLHECKHIANIGGGNAGVLVEEGTARNAMAREIPMPKVCADVNGILNHRRRLEWTKDWLRKNQAEFLSKENIQEENQFRFNEPYHLNSFLHITERQFRHLVKILEPVISSMEPQRKKKTFSAEERIAITLKYLATGEYHSCRNYCFRASKQVILRMISEICQKIFDLLKDQFLTLPKTEEQWQNIVNGLQRKNSKLSHCLGNIALRRVEFYNTGRANDKHSATPNEEWHDLLLNKAPLVMSTIVDSDNYFMYVDIERTKASTLGEVFEKSTIKQMIEENAFHLPPVKSEEKKYSDYYFVGNNLPVKPYLLRSHKPDATKPDDAEYWHAMETANLHSEHALHMLSNVFQILTQPLRIEEDNARKILLGCVALYNFLRKTDKAFYIKTESLNRKLEEQNSSANVGNNQDDEDDDDDCIMLGNEEEIREREEFTPKVAQRNCFIDLCYQKGDTAEGLAKEEYLKRQIAVASA